MNNITVNYEDYVDVNLTLNELKTIDRALDELYIEEVWDELITSHMKIKNAIEYMEGK